MSFSQDIISLLKALEFSPQNVQLRVMLAQKFLEENHMDELKEHAEKILELDANNLAAKELLCEWFYRNGKYKAILMLAENLPNIKQASNRLQILYTKALLQDGNTSKARDMYEFYLHKNPTFTDNELDSALRLQSMDLLDEIEQSDDVFLQKPNVRFEDVGGLDGVKKEISMKIIKPLENPELFKAYGKKIGGGILLFGPPGCGKTFIAKATAGEIDAKFINVGISDILDMWIGKSEQNLSEMFDIARKNKPCVLFFDEVDALGANRSSFQSSAGKNVINQFLSELDGISSDNDGLLVIGATNMPWALDSAFRRPGRFDRIIFVPPPDKEGREKIFELLLKDKPIGQIDYTKLAKNTDGYSGADIQAVIDIAVESKLEIAMENGQITPVVTADILKAIKKHRPTTREWFNTVKNYVLYANQGGIYDDVIKYIK